MRSQSGPLKYGECVSPRSVSGAVRSGSMFRRLALKLRF